MTTGDQAVGACRAIVFRLEGGDEVSFDLAEETRIPGDIQEQWELLGAVPARLAFWLYQERRAFRQLRLAEAGCKQVEAEWYLRCRASLMQIDTSLPTERYIESTMVMQDDVRTARRRVMVAKNFQEQATAAREAVQSLLHVLRTRVQTYRASGPAT